MAGAVPGEGQAGELGKGCLGTAAGSPGPWSQQQPHRALRDRVGFLGCLCWARCWTLQSSWVPFQLRVFCDLHRQHIQGTSQHLLQDLKEREQPEPTLTLETELAPLTEELTPLLLWAFDGGSQTIHGIKMSIMFNQDFTLCSRECH